MTRSKRSRIAIGLACASTLWISLLACGGPQATPPGPPSSFAPGCGMSLFTQPHCEEQIDSICCAQQDQCARDEVCSRIAQCWAACDAQAMEMKKRGQEGACGCFLNCNPQGHETPGRKNWASLVSCLQFKPQSPPGMTCGSQC